MITVKTFTLAANQAVPLGVKATFLRVLTGNYSFRIEGYFKNEKVVDFDGITAGLAVADFGHEIISRNDPLYNPDNPSATKPQEIDTLIITNGSTAQTVAITVGDGKVDDNRLVGTVNITGGLNTSAISAAAVQQYVYSALSTVGTTVSLAVGNDMDTFVQNMGNIALELFVSGAKGKGIVLEPIPTGGNVGGAVSIPGGVNWYAAPYDGVTLTARCRVTQTQKP